jgi:hypothetical protein
MAGVRVQYQSAGIKELASPSMVFFSASIKPQFLSHKYFETSFLIG